MIVFTVLDCKAKYYMTPHFAVSKGESLRQFIAASNDPEHAFFQSPRDFILFQLGTFDPNTGRITVFEAPLELGRAWELKQTDPEPVDTYSKFQKITDETETPNNG
ncbi:nonstructural protein [Microviridae sp.]|nr:nonstructural protein [Microviridae sp.]